MTYKGETKVIKVSEGTPILEAAEKVRRVQRVGSGGGWGFDAA